jgi:hypothetical protein
MALCRIAAGSCHDGLDVIGQAPQQTQAGRSGGHVDQQRDFFISYTGADVAWAEWIADTLEPVQATPLNRLGATMPSELSQGSPASARRPRSHRPGARRSRQATAHADDHQLQDETRLD